MVSKEIERDPVGIEFTDDHILCKNNGEKVIIRTLDDRNRNICDLVDEFKRSLDGLSVLYKEDPNAEEFKPLRKFYATGLRNAYLNDNPENSDKVFKILRQANIGAEIKYYIDLKRKRIQSEVYRKFFTNGPGLYTSIDGQLYDSYTGIGTQLSPLNVPSWIKDGNDPEKYKQESKELFKKPSKYPFPQNWTHEYNKRIFLLYGYPTRWLEKQKDIVDGMIKQFRKNLESHCS